VREVVQYSSWLIGLPLELLVIAALVRGPYRRFPLLLLYNIALFLTTSIEMAVSQAYYADYYWVDEGIREGLLFAVVLSFAYLATEKVRSRNMVRIGLIAGGVVFAVGSFLIHHHLTHGTSRWLWMTPWVRDIDFAAAVIDLAVWTLLIASQQKNTQVLLLAAGVGIQFAGAAIGESLRFLFHHFTLPGDSVEVITALVGMWVWWQALRAAPVPKAARIAISAPRDRTGATR
jgi:uncharacterized membrane protein